MLQLEDMLLITACFLFFIVYILVSFPTKVKGEK